MKYSMIAIAAAFALGTGAQAASISVQTFTYAAFGNLTKNSIALEDFESPGDLSFTFEGGGTGRNPGANDFGEVTGSIGTSVGSFTGLGGTGNGLQEAFGCRKYLQQHRVAVRSVHERATSCRSDWSINAADTLGIAWSAFLPGGGKFGSLVFALRDATDQGATLTVETDGSTASFSGLVNDNRQLIVIDFGGAVSSAMITMRSSKVNDSFTIDGAALNAVPLPAAALLLLGGLGVMAGLRKRKAA